MTLAEWLALQDQMMTAFAPLLRWWLILFLVGMVFAAVLVWMLMTAQEMISKL